MRAALLVLVLAVPVLVAACGGGDDEGGGRERLSKTELVERANAICSDFDKRVEEIQKKYEARITGFEDEKSLDALAEFAGESRSTVEDGVEELRELEPPEDLEDRYDAWLATADQTLERIDELAEAAEARDRAEVGKIIRQVGEEEQDSDRLAQELGLTECAND